MQCRPNRTGPIYQPHSAQTSYAVTAPRSIPALRRSSLGRYLIKPHRPQVRVQVATPSKLSPSKADNKNAQIEGPSTDLSVIFERLQRLVLPYWVECPDARWRLAGVVGLTLATTGVSVVFSFLGRDFYNALSDKDVEGFKVMIVKYLAGFVLGIPVFVYSDYLQSRLALEWREWLTSHLLSKYFADRSFYQLQAGALVDNPDQRIAADVRQFTDAALGLSLTILNSLIDLVSFSGILYSIYPPLFAALLAYSVGGTLGSIALGKSLVGLNFNQEAVEADLRYGLVRVRENAESIAFYGGQSNEMAALMQRLQAVVANYSKLLIASRNLDFFTSFYRFLIQLLPAAVVAPLFFAGKIEFGVITQSSSAFNHILNDVSLVVYQFDTLAGFSAVVDRLGEFQEVVDVKLRHTHPRVKKQRAAAASLAAAVASASAAESAASSVDEDDKLTIQQATTQITPNPAAAAAAAAKPEQDTTAAQQAAVAAATAAAAAAANGAPEPGIQIVYVLPDQNGSSSSSVSRVGDSGDVLLELDHVSINTPDGSLALVQDVSLKVHQGQSLLIMGPSGAGKTSMLRTLAGLWQSGAGTIYSYGLMGLGDPGVGAEGSSGVLFLPQKPYMVLGSLRDQLLYPTWTQRAVGDGAQGQAGQESSGSGSGNRQNGANGNGSGAVSNIPAKEMPTDEQLEAVLQQVQLGQLIQRCKAAMAAAADAEAATDDTNHQQPPRSPTPIMTSTSAPHAVLQDASSSSAGHAGRPVSPLGVGEVSALDYVADWSGMLSLGEQQRLAFARLLLAAPKLALLDEATSALDTKNEELLYKALMQSGSTVISVGHRPTLIAYHSQVLQLGASKGSIPGKWQVVPAQQLMAAGSKY